MRTFTLFLATALIALGCGGGPTAPPTSPPPPAFSYSLSNSGDVTVVKNNASVQVTVSKHLATGSTQAVSLALSGLPSGVTVSMGNGDCSPACQSTITLTASPSTATGSYSLTVTGSPGNVTTSFTLIVTAPPVTLVSAAVRGDTTLEAPTPKQYRLVGNYSDGSEQDLTATWGYPNPDYVVGEVSATGVLIPHALGVIRVQATYQGVTYTLQVRIVGTPRNQLPAISNAAWVWVTDSVRASNGMLQRFAAGQKKVFVGAGFNPSKVASATNRLSMLLKGELTFVQTPDSASADIHFMTVPPETIPRCAAGGPITNAYGPVLRGSVLVVAGSSCIDNENLLLHELVHAVGFMGHVSEAGVMSTTSFTADFGPFFTEIAQWVYNPLVKPAIIPVP